ncbi:15457_t:CDS:2 [Acaulospora morrowiae]|uniref:15457_t:CDS:1 n=1 Tax=Acaulospora morrowiae TaxID=94023 RepID=A0A9N9EMV2_9GLOM|nr:15457_t:CDS:2 [Acaulospora morrowiae]
MDGQFNHAHLRNTKHLDFIDKWGSDKLPEDEIAVPLKYQPPTFEESEDFELIPEQLKQGTDKWKDLALDFLSEEPRQQRQQSHHQQSQQIQ